jgi:hypothetical protein
MRFPSNPTRRSRNIGTAKQGHGQDNRLRIPDTAAGFYIREIGQHARFQREIRGRAVTFLVEETLQGWLHPCSVDEMSRLLEYFDPDHWDGLYTFVLRQPTRKQHLLEPIWGRISYDTDIASRQGQILASGPTLFVAAIEEDAVHRWPASLGPNDKRELERLRKDGHKIDFDGRYHLVRVSRSSARNTVLYRTIPHEIGHWVDWLQQVARPADRGQDYGELADLYFARPSAEREAFAHRYASEWIDKLRAEGVVPFEPAAETSHLNIEHRGEPV